MKYRGGSEFGFRNIVKDNRNIRAEEGASSLSAIEEVLYVLTCTPAGL